MSIALIYHSGSTPRATASGQAVRVGALLLLAASLAWAAAPNKSPTLVLENAGTMRNTYTNGQLFIELRDKVTFVYDDVTISSDEAKWWRDNGIVESSGHVVMSRTRQKLTCDKLRYTNDTKMLLAQGHLIYLDRDEKLIISGEQCRYNLKTKKIILDGAPRVVRYDSTNTDTLTIVAKQMIYEDSLKMTVANNDVVITKGDLRSTSQKASYFTQDGLTLLRKDPHITYEKHELLGDSVNLYFADDTLQGMSVTSRARAKYIDEGRSDTTLTRVSGDSLYMAFTKKGNLDTVRVFGAVKSAYSPVTDTTKPNRVAGKTMVLSFGEKSQVDRAIVAGNATSVYYMEDEKDTLSKARNEASGDSLSVWFRNGQATRLRLSGGVRGTYYP